MDIIEILEWWENQIQGLFVLFNRIMFLQKHSPGQTDVTFSVQQEVATWNWHTEPSFLPRHPLPGPTCCWPKWNLYVPVRNLLRRASHQDLPSSDRPRHRVSHFDNDRDTAENDPVLDSAPVLLVLLLLEIFAHLLPCWTPCFGLRPSSFCYSELCLTCRNLSGSSCNRVTRSV